MKTYKNIENYLNENYNYIKESSDIEDCIMENISYKMFIPCINNEYAEKLLSPILSIFWDETITTREFYKKVCSVIKELSKEEVSYLLKFDGVGLDIIETAYFQLEVLTVPSFIIDFNYTTGDYGKDEASSGKLKDPFYAFPELDILNKVKSQFNLSEVSIVNLFDEEYYEFREYKENREEYDIYYNDFLRDQLINNSSQNDIEKLEKLKEYLFILKRMKLEKEVLNSCKLEKSSEANYMLSSMKDDLIKRRKQLPSKYREVDVIENEIKRLIK